MGKNTSSATTTTTTYPRKPSKQQMQVQSRMDLDQQHIVNDENANILNVKMMQKQKGKANKGGKSKSKRAFGQDLTNKASATNNAANIQQVQIGNKQSLK